MKTTKTIFLLALAALCLAGCDLPTPGHGCDAPEPIECFTYGCVCPQEASFCATNPGKWCCLGDENNYPTSVGICDEVGQCRPSECLCDPYGEPCTCRASVCGAQLDGDR